jgi:hypothetical protein
MHHPFNDVSVWDKRYAGDLESRTVTFAATLYFEDAAPKEDYGIPECLPCNHISNL